MSNYKAGPWEVCGPTELLLHGVSVPGVTGIQVTGIQELVDVTSIGGTNQRFAPSRTVIEMKVILRIDPDFNYPHVPKEFVRDQVVEELMSRILCLEKENTRISSELAAIKESVENGSVCGRPFDDCWGDGDDKNSWRVCDHCKNVDICKHREDPFIREVYPEEPAEASWWCKNCFELRCDQR